jgi:sulfur-oxidizing protein SoxB
MNSDLLIVLISFLIANILILFPFTESLDGAKRKTMFSRPIQQVILAAMAVMLTAMLVSGCSSTATTYDVRILWTNDTHGYLSPLYHREEGEDQFVERSKRDGRVGGFAYIASIINRQRNELPGRTLLLDSGDTWHGTVVPVRLGGTPVVEVMNAMGYDAMTPGNVDFFYDQATLERLFSAANFPVLAANFYDAEFDERVNITNVKPYIIKQVGDRKIAIIGMTYHWMSKLVDHKQWIFGLRMDEVQADIDKLRSQEQVDLVILLSHMGWKADARYAELVSGIDVIVGAHTHDTLYRPTLVYNKESKRDVLIVQSGSHGKNVGQLDLKVNNRRVTAFKQTLFPVHIKEITPDPKIAAMIEELRAPYKAELERVIGETSTLLYRQGTWQSTADNLVSDALLARTRQDIAITQPGRYGASILPGPITVEDVYNLVPTEAPVYLMKFQGKSLREMMEGAVDNVVADNELERIGANMWRFSGIELAIDTSQPYPNRVQNMQIKGIPVNDKQLYTLAEFNMYLRNSPTAIDVKQTDYIGPHEVIAYIEEQGHIAPQLDKRITDHHGQILGDHKHLHEVWAETGRNEVDLDNAKAYQYQGKLDETGRLSVAPKR